MEIINDRTVVVFSSLELKEVLEGENNYSYIYFGSNITLDSGITIDGNKKSIVIDGTYNDNRYILNGMNSSLESDCIKVSIGNKKIEVRNMDINYTNPFGVIYVPLDSNYSGILTFYNNISFIGTELSYNPYGTTKIVDCNISIETVNEVSSEEVCESNSVIIGGNTNISSSSLNSTLFYFRHTSNPSVIFLCKSNVIISTDTKEFMTGTNRLNFTILHDTKVNLVTGNGFSNNTVTGTNNVSIGERASFTFIEKSHQRIPMWNVFGNFIMKENSKLELINSYSNTPSDNYNIHFKGTNQKLILDNAEVAIYTKNANVIYTNNPISFSIRGRRINMWENSVELTNAGGIYDLPDYSWYKSDSLVEIYGTVTSSDTTVTSHNLTSEELTKLDDLSNFSFQGKKEFSIGGSVINVHQINSNKNTISGHTVKDAEVLIKYGDVTEVVNTDSDGLFKYDLISSISDNTEIEIISSVPGSFIYETRIVTTPYEGEISLISSTPVVTFDLTPISSNPIILPKSVPLVIKVVDSRLNSSNWKLYAYIDKPLTSELGYVLEGALVFKKFDDDIVVLDSIPSLVFEGTENTNVDEASLVTINWSTQKGVLLDLSSNFLEIGEEYFADVHFIIEE